MYKIKFDYRRQDDIEAFYSAAAKVIIQEFKDKNNLTMRQLPGMKNVPTTSTMLSLMSGKLMAYNPKRKVEKIKFITVMGYLKSITGSHHTRILINGEAVDFMDKDILKVMAQSSLNKALKFSKVQRVARTLTSYHGSINTWNSILHKLKNGQEQQNHIFKYLVIIGLSGATVEIHSDFQRLPESLTNPIQDLLISQQDLFT